MAIEGHAKEVKVVRPDKHLKDVILQFKTEDGQEINISIDQGLAYWMIGQVKKITGTELDANAARYVTYLGMRD